MSFISDTLFVYRRQQRLILRVPAFLIVGVLQPILYLALFGPLLTRLPAGTLSGGSGTGGTAEAYRFFVPGLLIQLALFGSTFVGFAIISEWRAGIIERYRVTPVSRVALLTGRVLRDVVTLIVQSTVLILAGLAFGLRAPLGAVLLSYVYLVLVAIGLSSLSYAVALQLKSEDAFAPLVNSVVVPLILLSGVMLPMTLGPGLAAGNRADQPVPLHHRRHAGGVRRALLGRGHGRGALRGRRHGGGAALAGLARLRQRERVTLSGWMVRQPVSASRESDGGIAATETVSREGKRGVDHAKLAQAHAQGFVIDVLLTGLDHLRGALAHHLVDGRQLAPVRRIPGFHGLAPWRDVPQLQILVAGAQRPRKRVLRRVVQDQQPQPPGKPQATGLTHADRVPEESGRSHAGGLKRDDARDRQQPARVVFAGEALEPAGKEQNRQDIVRWPGHRGGGPVSRRAGRMSACSVLRIRCIAQAPPLPATPRAVASQAPPLPGRQA